MAKISQTTNYYQIDGDAGGTAVIQINGNTSTTTITGATTVTNGLTIDASGLTVTAGGATITAGNFEVTAGTVTFGSLASVGLMTTSVAGVVGTIATGSPILNFSHEPLTSPDIA